MKFGKEFASQMVPEWQQAYMDYNTLKTILKEIMTFRQRNATSSAKANPKSTLRRRVSLYRAFSGLASRNSPRKRDDEPIMVGAVQQGGSEERYQTMFLMSSDDGGEYELIFFRRLDEEFNKVVRFYRKKVEEVVDEANELTRQMNVLIALRIKVENPEIKEFNSTARSKDRSKSSHTGGTRMDAIQEVEMSGADETEEGERRESIGVHGFRPSSLEILDHVKIHVEPETPKSTLLGILTGSTSDLSFSKEELKKSEELMTKAFAEFHHKLRLLKSYCFMNQLAFSKIMKKYDKVTLRNASKSYLDMVDNSYLGSCDEVMKLMERSEAAFVKHFSNGNRRKAMNVLRPKRRKEMHRVTFFMGLFTGCAIALVVTILVLIQSRNLLSRERNEDRKEYMDIVFPLYTLFGFIILHMIMYSANIFFWRRYKVNYSFIFGFKEGTDVSYRDVLLVSAGLSVLTLAAAASNLDMDMDRNPTLKNLPELVPLILVAVLLVIMFCPFNIIYRSSRFFFIQCVFHCVLAPLYKVTFPDFFLADQLTSEVQAIRSLQFYVCYYIWGDFKEIDSKCLQKDLYKAFYIVIAIIPYWMRLLQCIRRLIEEKGAMHALNGGKYLSIIIAVSARTILEQRRVIAPNNTTTLEIVAWSTSAVATVYATCWDLFVDWGLLQRKSKNRWLRDKLIVPNKSVYFVAIVLNCLLRLAWMQTVMGFNISFLHKKATIAVVACLEIIRRGLWNFFRLENEHLNNVGKYRAFKSVPLPFNYDDAEKYS